MGVLIVVLVYQGRQRRLIDSSKLENRTIAGAYPLPAEIIENDKNVYFAYTEIPNMIYNRMEGVSLGEDCPVNRDDLRYLTLLYLGIDGEPHKGEMIVHKDIAQKVSDAFYKLYRASYQIERVQLVDDFGANDEVSMGKNNSSCFNGRKIAGTEAWSNHAYGLAIDINPFYNPYVGEDGTILPVGAEEYVDREKSFSMKISQRDFAYEVFTSLGFTWGGDWNGIKDYQHFEYSLDSNN